MTRALILSALLAFGLGHVATKAIAKLAHYNVEIK